MITMYYNISYVAVVFLSQNILYCTHLSSQDNVIRHNAYILRWSEVNDVGKHCDIVLDYYMSDLNTSTVITQQSTW